MSTMGVGTVDLSLPKKQLKMKYAVYWRYRSSVGGSSFSLLKRSLRLTRGSLTPEADAQNGAPVHWEHSHLTGAKIKGPRVVKESLHPLSHQWMAHVYVWDTEKRAETQLRQKLIVLPVSTTQELAEVRPPTSTSALDTRILHEIRKKNVSTKRSWKTQSKETCKSI